MDNPSKMTLDFGSFDASPGENDPGILKNGDIVDGCNITGFIARGAMCAVYRAFEIDLEVERAIKILLPNMPDTIQQKFAAEGKVMVRLSHDNIVAVHGTGRWKQTYPYIKLEYIDGKSVRNLLIAHTSFHPAFALSVIIAICRALEYASKQTYSIWGTIHHGIVHCDLKPENLLITRDGIVKVMDFGVAQTGPTVTKGAMGTLQYMSPEQHDDKTIEGTSDIYSLGVILYEMICGVRPFSEELAEMVTQKTYGTYSSIGDFSSALSEELQTIVATCLQPLPENRYQSYADLQTACERTLATMTPLSTDRLTSAFIKDADAFRELIHHSKKDIRTKKKKIPVIAIIGSAMVISAGALALAFKYIPFPSSSPESTVASITSASPEKKNDPVPVQPVESTPPESKQAVPAPVPEPHASERTTSAVPKKNESAKTTEPPKQTNVPVSEQTAVPDNKPLPLTIAAEAYDKRDYKKVLQLLAPLAESGSSGHAHDSIVIMLVESYYMTSAFDKVIGLSRTAPVSDARYHMVLGLTYEALDEHKNAASSFENAIIATSRFSPENHAEALLQRARFYVRRFRATQNSDIQGKLITAWKDVEREFCGTGGKACAEAQSFLKQYAGK